MFAQGLVYLVVELVALAVDLKRLQKSFRAGLLRTACQEVSLPPVDRSGQFLQPNVLAAICRAATGSAVRQ